MKNSKKKPKLKKYNYGGAALSGATTGLGMASSIAPMAGPYAPIVMGAGAVIGAGAGLLNEQKTQEQLKQDEYNQYMNNINYTQKQRISSSPMVDGAPPTAFKHGGYKLYPNGGIHSGPFNAEIEREEIVQTPDGSTQQIDGASHENGGVDVNLPNQSRIFSDRLKDPSTRKTYAKMAEKYKVNKEEKTLKDENSSSIARTTANLNMDLKQRKLDEIFNQQEMLKQSKLSGYAKRLGVELPSTSQDQFKNGGTYNLPKYAGTPPYETSGVFTDEKSSPYLTSANSFTFANNRYEDLPTNVADVRPSNFYNTPIQMDPNQMSSNSIVSSPQPSNVNNTPSSLIPNGKTNSGNFNWQDAAVMAGNLAMPTYALATNKAPQTYNIAKPEFKKYDPTQALAEADRQNRIATANLKSNSGGNVGSYLSNLQGLQSNNTANKLAVINKYNNLNTETYNNAQMPLAQMQTQRNIDKQHDDTANRDFKTAQVGQIGTAIASGAKDSKAGKFDQKYLDFLNANYPHLAAKYKYNYK
jgi:hypothetical protein